MASNKVNQVKAGKKSFWITIEGDVETNGRDENGKLANGYQRLPQLRNIKNMLESLQNASKIESYVCAFEKGSCDIISVNLVYFRCAFEVSFNRKF